ncbi:hypothetical protein PT974_08093 [Cladobotryum mycophilum]|uniref:Transcription factor domain-containing protein n=1 Tax=Cladobotryum mycophilum TaxID=491253 RepID=A0ABR0SCD1_9HYPO
MENICSMPYVLWEQGGQQPQNRQHQLMWMYLRQIFIDKATEEEKEAVLRSGTHPGDGWAKTARDEVFANFSPPTTVALLCEYELQAERTDAVFLLVSYLYRGIRLLGLDAPPLILHPDSECSQITEMECNNRLVWACFFFDRYVANGIEKNMYEIEGPEVAVVAQRLDLPALSILAIHLWTKARNFQENAGPHARIWEVASEYRQVNNQLYWLQGNMHKFFRLAPQGFDGQQSAGVLGAVFALHLYIETALIQQMRASFDNVDYPLRAAFKNSPPDFQEYIHGSCCLHASLITKKFHKAMSHTLSGEQGIFDDTFCTKAIVEATRVHIISTTSKFFSKEEVDSASNYIQIGLDFLRNYARCGKNTRRIYVMTYFPPLDASADNCSYVNSFSYVAYMGIGTLFQDSGCRPRVIIVIRETTRGYTIGGAELFGLTVKDLIQRTEYRML